MHFKIPAARPSRGVALDRLLVVIGVPLAAALAWTAALTGANRQAAAAVPTFRARLAHAVRADPAADLPTRLDLTDHAAAAGGGALVDPPNTTFATCGRSEPCGWFGCSFRLGTAEFPDATDPRDRDLVRATVRRRVDEVAGCYEERSRELPTVDGSVIVDLDIAPHGEVATARLVESTDVPDLSTARCIAGTLRTWVFPALSGPDHVTARYSFALSPPE
jgi:hypothetical protein